MFECDPFGCDTATLDMRICIFFGTRARLSDSQLAEKTEFCTKYEYDVGLVCEMGKCLGSDDTLMSLCRAAGKESRRESGVFSPKRSAGLSRCRMTEDFGLQQGKTQNLRRGQ